MIAKSPGQFGADTEVYRSMGLDALVRELAEEGRYTVLDLGPALGANVDFWSGFACKIHFADLHGTLAEAGLEAGGEAAVWDPALLQRLLPFEPETRFDIILCWDILNYLTQEQVTSLVARLAEFCKQGTYLFAQFWLSPRIPARPITFKIVDREHLRYANRDRETRSWAFFQPRDINKIMEDFRVAGSFLLRHGIQEYLFVYRGSTPRE